MCRYSNHYPKFIVHLREEHQLTRRKVILKYGNCMNKSVRHICKICQQDLQYEYHTLSLHLKTKHCSKVPDYQRTFLGGKSNCSPAETSVGFSIYSCNKCQFAGNLNALKKHVKNKHTLDIHLDQARYGRLKLKKSEKQDCKTNKKIVKLNTKKYFNLVPEDVSRCSKRKREKSTASKPRAKIRNRGDMSRYEVELAEEPVICGVDGGRKIPLGEVKTEEISTFPGKIN